MTELKDLGDEELVEMICGVYTGERIDITIDRVREEILSRFKRGNNE